MSSRGKSIQVVTLGCSKNDVDTRHLLSGVQDELEIVPEGEDRPVDFLLINTCGFIADAKEESIQAILAAAGRKKEGKVGKLLVFGCLSQRYSSELPSLIPEVDGWFGARDIDPVLRAVGVEPKKGFIPLRKDPAAPCDTYAFLKISEGCDRRCSYCAIPFIRGRHRSVPIERLEEEARALAFQGVRELVIIAQDTTYYGLDIYGKRSLAELLRRLSAIDGIEWLRIHYSYPADFPDDVLHEMAVNPKVCKYLDIPLQHISDKVLGMMRRGVDGDRTRSLVRRLREEVPGVVLRTTMIVGHPGEGPEEFGELMDFVSEVKFERLGAFKYSEEEGTYGACHYEDSVSDDEKQRRLDALMTLQGGISESFNQSRVGSVEKVLVDDCIGGILVCRSQWESPEVDGEISVPFDSGLFGNIDPSALRGRFIEVKITGADVYDLTAVPLKILK